MKIQQEIVVHLRGNQIIWPDADNIAYVGNLCHFWGQEIVAV